MAGLLRAAGSKNAASIEAALDSGLLVAGMRNQRYLRALAARIPRLERDRPISRKFALTRGADRPVTVELDRLDP